jgi:hypothetical protein
MFPGSRQIAIALKRSALTALFARSEWVELMHIAFLLLQPGTNARAVLAVSGCDVPAVVSAVANITFTGSYDDLTRDWVDEGVRTFEMPETEEEMASYFEAFKHPVRTIPDWFLGISHEVSTVLGMSKLIASKRGSTMSNTAHLFLAVITAATGTDLGLALTESGVTSAKYESALSAFAGPWEN